MRMDLVCRGGGPGAETHNLWTAWVAGPRSRTAELLAADLDAFRAIRGRGKGRARRPSGRSPIIPVAQLLLVLPAVWPIKELQGC